MLIKLKLPIRILFSIDDPCLDHFHPQVVSFPCSLAHPGKHGVAAVVLRNVIDELHDDHGLANTSTTEGPNLSPLGEGADQVDHLDPGFKDFGRS